MVIPSANICIESNVTSAGAEPMIYLSAYFNRPFMMFRLSTCVIFFIDERASFGIRGFEAFML